MTKKSLNMMLSGGCVSNRAQIVLSLYRFSMASTGRQVTPSSSKK